MFLLSILNGIQQIFICFKFYLSLSSIVPSSAPRNVTAIAINSTAILVRWQEVVPEDRNGNITGYEVMYMPLTDLMGSLNTTPQVTQVTSDLSIVIGDLEEFIFYAVLVRASTSAGSGNFSDPTSTQTLEDGEV